MLVGLAEQKPKYGYRFLYRMLRRRGFAVNHKRVYRLYREEGLGPSTASLRRVAARIRAETRSRGPGLVDDFVHAHLANGRRFRVLTTVDKFSRRSPGILADWSISGERVTRFLDEVAVEAVKVDFADAAINNL